MGVSANAASAVAPATVSNVGPGYDVLGFALDGPCDRADVSVSLAAGRGAGFSGAVTGVTAAEAVEALPPLGEGNTAAIAARETLRLAEVPGHAAVHLHKGLAVGTGLGSSAASAVAGAFATNLAIGRPLRRSALIEACLVAEEAASGRHADNVAPALLGGLVLVRSLEPLDVVRVPVPAGLRAAVVVPALSVLTREARAAVPATVVTQVAVSHAADLGALVAACHAGDLDLLARCVKDRIAEPARVGLIAGAGDALAAMRGSGALGASISGSGPTLFALCRSEESARACADAAVGAFDACGVAALAFTSAADRPGVREL